MSMSTHVIGFIPPDETWQKMKALRDACLAAGVCVPPEVHLFFSYQDPDPTGTEVSIPIREWDGEWGSGYELDVAAIPGDVKVIRFYISY